MARARKGAKKARALRVFFATDVHGSERCFRKFLAAAKVYEANVLLLGGDVAGKGLVPVYAENGSLTAVVRGESVTLPAAEEERLNDDILHFGMGHRAVQSARQRHARKMGYWRDGSVESVAQYFLPIGWMPLYS